MVNVTISKLGVGSYRINVRMPHASSGAGWLAHMSLATDLDTYYVATPLSTRSNSFTKAFLARSVVSAARAAPIHLAPRSDAHLLLMIFFLQRGITNRH